MLFCAHAIFYFKLRDQEQSTFLVHENVYLVEAKDGKHAEELAQKIGAENEDPSEDGHLEVNEQKASYVFAGIRKIIETEPTPAPASAPSLVGLELTYSEFELDTLDQVRALARGDMVDILYRE